MTQQFQATRLDSANLTQLETVALTAAINVADGHARQDLSKTQRDIVCRFPELFHEAARVQYPELDNRAQRAFFDVLGQRTAPVGTGRILTCYASSIAMEILARALTVSVRSVGLIHPTFDNIPDILAGLRLDLVPLEEHRLLAGDPTDLFRWRIGGLFITTPNNPTGTVVPAARLREIAAACAERDVVLMLDTSFRGFDRRAHYDHYAILDESGCRYVVIEDTGKLWPTLDLKVGFLVISENIRLPISRIYSDILLNVSPFILLVVKRFADDAAAGGLERLHADIADNRARLRAALSPIPHITFPDPDSRASVERIRLDGPTDGRAVAQLLRLRGVHVLPCGPFFWADHAVGDRFLRIALARPPSIIDSAVAAVSSALRSVVTEPRG